MARPLSSLVVVLSLLAGSCWLGGCGGSFATATPVFAQYRADEVLNRLRAAGLRVENAQNQPVDKFIGRPPPFQEAKSFAAGPVGSKSTATLFTFQRADDLAAMEKYLTETYPKQHRQIIHHNLLLVFWGADTSDTLNYDAVILALP